MSALTLALIPAAVIAVALGAAALHTAHGLRRQLTQLRAELLAERTARANAAATAAADIPVVRATPAVEMPLADIRAAVADALAEERERELAEARAFWAAQEARDVADAPSLLGGVTGLGEDSPFDGRNDKPDTPTPLFLPRQADFAGIEPLLGTDGPDSLEALDVESVEESELAESAELAAARRRHPSHPDFSPSPVVGDHERTAARLDALAEDRIPLADVRPGPLGTLDVYVFADDTTVCLTPGHRETAEVIAEALRSGESPVLLGGSGISGAYALTFAWGENHEESVYVLADRVIASV